MTGMLARWFETVKYSTHTRVRFTDQSVWYNVEDFRALYDTSLPVQLVEMSVNNDVLYLLFRKAW